MRTIIEVAIGNITIFSASTHDVLRIKKSIRLCVKGASASTGAKP